MPLWPVLVLPTPSVFTFPLCVATFILVSSLSHFVHLFYASSIKCLLRERLVFNFFLFFAPPQHQILGKGFLSRSCHLQSHFFLECTKSLVLSSLGVCDQHIVQWLVLGKSLTPVHHCQIWNQVCEN